MKLPWILKDDARDEAYAYFDENISRLPRNPDGSFDISDPVFVDSDVDAFRHAYVSGVFTMEYGSTTAEFFGNLNEWFSLSGSGRRAAGSDNMDLWNNAIGRQLGSEAESRDGLAKKIEEALVSGTLITTPNDPRRYEGANKRELDPLWPVVVLKESNSGRNEIFCDLISKKVFDREEFVQQIRAKNYPGYTIRRINGVPTPVAKSNRSANDNLG